MPRGCADGPRRPPVRHGCQVQDGMCVREPPRPRDWRPQVQGREQGHQAVRRGLQVTRGAGCTRVLRAVAHRQWLMWCALSNSPRRHVRDDLQAGGLEALPGRGLVDLRGADGPDVRSQLRRRLAPPRLLGCRPSVHGRLQGHLSLRYLPCVCVRAYVLCVCAHTPSCHASTNAAVVRAGVITDCNSPDFNGVDGILGFGLPKAGSDLPTPVLFAMTDEENKDTNGESGRQVSRPAREQPAATHAAASSHEGGRTRAREGARGRGRAQLA